MISGLINGTAYYVRVSAANVAGTGSALTAVTPVTPLTFPSAPSISSIVADDSQLSVRFSAGSSGGSTITSYQYSINGGSTWVSASGTSDPIIISGLINGTRYQVALRAINVVGSGDVSNIIASTPRKTPGAPTISSVTAGANQASVAFTLADDGGSAITSYEYRVRSSSWTTWESGGTSTSPLVIGNLANGTTYDVQIRAVNAAGAGLSTATASVTPFSTPGAPSITSIAGAVGQVSIAFSAGVTGGALIANYSYSLDGGATWITLSPASTLSPIVVSGLVNATLYSVQLKAINAAGSGAASSTATVRTHGAPSQPMISSMTARNGALGIAFAAGANGGDPVTNYEYSLDGGATWVTRSPASTLTPLTISGLTNGTTYSISLRAVNAVGSGTASTSISGKPHSVPAAPTIASQPGVSNQTLIISFSAGDDGGESIASYEFSTDRGATWLTRTDGETTASPMTITKLSSDGTTDLSNGTTYDVQIRATNAVGVGVACDDVSGSPATTPSAPSSLDITNGNRYLLVAFVSGSNGGRAITSYEYSTDGGATWRASDAGTSMTSSPITITKLSSDGTTDLTNGDNYTVQLRAISSVGAGTPSISSIGTPSTNPGVPSSVVATFGDESISVTFEEGSTGGSAITSYEYSTDGGATWRTRDAGASMTSSPITITKLSSDGLTVLTNGTAYDVLIRSVNTAGVGRESATLTVIPAGAPAMPAITSVTSLNGGLSVTFTAGNSGGRSVIRNEYSIDGGSTWIVAPTLESPIVLSGLTNATSYELQVRQVNPAGDGESSITVAGTPYTAPGAPTVDQIVAGNGTLAVQFTNGVSGGSPATSFEYSTDDGATWRTRRTGSVESPLTISMASNDGTTALQNGTFYSVKIRAVNAAGSGTESESVRIASFTVPSAPVISSVAMRNSFALLTYSVASNGGASITEYQYSLNGGITWLDASSTANPLQISGLRNGTVYSLILRALNRSGSSDSSSTVSLAPSGPPDAPLVTSLTPSDQTLLVEFTGGDSSGSPITGYGYSLDGGTTWITAGVATSSPLTITGLTNGTIYTVRIRAINANGSGTSSDPVVSKPYTVPGVPVITRITLSGNNATLEYALPISNGGQAITAYEYSIDNGSSWVTTDSASVLSVQISNLVVDLNYRVGIRAVNSAGPGTASMVNTQSVSVEPALPVPHESSTPVTTPTRRPELEPSPITVDRPISPMPTTVDRPISRIPTTVVRPILRIPTTVVRPTSPIPTTTLAPLPVPTTPPRIASRDFLDGSGGIATSPGDAVVIVGGEVREITVTVTEGVGLIAGEGLFTIEITPRTASSEVVSNNGEQLLQGVRGGVIEVQGGGFAPNSTVAVWINSDPILLGTALTDNEGRFKAAFNLPSGIVAGNHTMTVSVVSQDGNTIRTSIGLVIVETEQQATSTDVLVGDDSSNIFGLKPLAYFALLMLFGWLIIVALRRRRK